MLPDGPLLQRASFCFETGFFGATACFPTASLIKKAGKRFELSH
jgi:hypothetical protein